MDDDTENTDAPDAANAMGGLSVYDPAAIRSKLAEYTDLSNSQKAYYDKLREEILARRAGPSASERLYQLGAALMAPTSVRGFSGTMNNVLPVLQQQAKDVREGKENRADALSKLEQAQLAARQGLLGQELTTDIALARINAAQNKAGEAKFDALTGGGYQQRPGTGGMPPMPEMDRYGNYVITDVRQVSYLPVNAKIVEVGQDPTKPKYVPAR